ncbi:MAG: ATP-dependent helicase, partial [Methylococcaceae bacterium]
MKVIHGIWTPHPKDSFIQKGQFYIWVETDEVNSRKIKNQQHPQQLTEQACLNFLKTTFAYSLNPYDPEAELQSVYLPTVDEKPLPDPELAMSEGYDEVVLQEWKVFACPLITPLKTIADIYFLSHYQHEDVRISRDFLFWYYFSQSLKQVIEKDQYIPAVLAEKTKTKTKLYRCWKIVSPVYETLVEQSLKSMPLACSQGYQAESLLRHFAEVTVNQILESSIRALPRVFTKKLQYDFLETILLEQQTDKPIRTADKVPEEFLQWHQWQQKFLQSHQQSALQLGFQLNEADAEHIDNWQLSFLLCSHKDPSFKLDLANYWLDSDSYRELISRQFENSIEQQLLVNLAHAARIYPKVWRGMETAEPIGLILSLDEAFDFLQEAAWVLEDAGYRVI